MNGDSVSVKRERQRGSAHEKNLDFAELDKRRIFIAVLILGAIVGLGGFLAKDKIPQFLAQKQKEITTSPQNENEAGEVAGISEERIQFEDQKQEVQKQIDEIKESITKLKPEDIKEQAQVKKILSDLDDLSKKATESAKVFDVKGNLCEEAKRRFCQ